MAAFCYTGPMQYKIIITPDDEGGYIAEVPDLPGCYCQGATLEETARNLEEAMADWWGKCGFVY